MPDPSRARMVAAAMAAEATDTRKTTTRRERAELVVDAILTAERQGAEYSAGWANAMACIRDVAMERMFDARGRSSDA